MTGTTSGSARSSPLAFFELGKAAIGFYIGKQGLESTYGAAASIIVVLIWVYYTSQIILMGAEITHAFAAHKGSIKQRDSIKQREEPAQYQAGQAPFHPTP